MMQPAPRDDMDLRTLFTGLTANPRARGNPGDDLPAREIVDLTLDSRAVVRDGLFLACRGASRHGLDFVADALHAGAGAIAWETDGVPAPRLPADVAGIPVPHLGDRLGEIANRFFEHPSEALSLVGITGTNGKTTTAWLVAAAIEHLGRRAGYLGTLGYGFREALSDAALTTPDCISFHRQLRAIVDAGGSHAIAEVSSHALRQARVAGAHFSTVAFSNLSRDHLDYHADLREYGEAKARLFHMGASHAVINLDDAFGRELAASLGARGDARIIGVSLADAAGTSLQGKLRTLTSEGLVLELSLAGQTAGRSADQAAVLQSPLWGRFNAENLLLAAGILIAEGWPLAAAAVALAACDAPPGRLQRVGNRQDQAEVLVDFAHTPDALAKALEAVREHCHGDIWCVFGCGGDRDRGKRAAMGAAAVAGAAHVVVTDDNPRSEESRRIIDDILLGVSQADHVEVIPDRAAAIRHAITRARPGDAVLIAGKGHERDQVIGNERRPFSDVDVARSALAAGRGS